MIRFHMVRIEYFHVLNDVRLINSFFAIGVYNMNDLFDTYMYIYLIVAFHYAVTKKVSKILFLAPSVYSLFMKSYHLRGCHIEIISLTGAAILKSYHLRGCHIEIISLTGLPY